MDGGKLKVLPSFAHMLMHFPCHCPFSLKVLYDNPCSRWPFFLSSDTGHDEALNSVTMAMANNDMCTQIKGDAGESRICTGGKIGEGVCDVSVI